MIRQVGSSFLTKPNKLSVVLSRIQTEANSCFMTYLIGNSFENKKFIKHVKIDQLTFPYTFQEMFVYYKIFSNLS